MFDVFVLALTATAVSGMATGAACHHGWLARAARKKRRIPAQWHLQARPLLLGSEQEVWHWLQRAFFDHHVLVKVPVIRFVSPRNEAEGQRSFELLKSVYCTFTVCAADGTVIGCLDVPGPQGLRASHRPCWASRRWPCPTLKPTPWPPCLTPCGRPTVAPSWPMRSRST